jgi:hypothetical protein
MSPPRKRPLLTKLLPQKLLPQKLLPQKLLPTRAPRRYPPTSAS